MALMAAACVPQVGPAVSQDPDGRCFAAERVPAIYEQIPGEIRVVQAEIADDGTVIRPPIYRRTLVPRVVRERSELRFATPCPDQMTPELIASLQRALAARGLYAGAATGRMDGATRAAIQRFQEPRGLDSAVLSLETARTLGLIAIPRSAL